MIDKITITTNISEKTIKFFGCHKIDTLTFTKIDNYFILSLGCIEAVVANLKITPFIVKFIIIDESGENLLQFYNGVLTIYEKDDKLLKYLRDTTKKWFAHLGGLYLRYYNKIKGISHNSGICPYFITHYFTYSNL